MRIASRAPSRDRTFVDTNVLVYTVDNSEPQKRARAHAVMRELGDSVVLSAQVLNEFYVAATTKLREPVSADDAASAVESLSRLPIVPVDLPLVRDGIAISRSAMISLWDGLIVAAAIAGGCTRLFTEDLQDRQTFGPVTVENPFRARG